jgi:hypothetical protein
MRRLIAFVAIAVAVVAGAGPGVAHADTPPAPTGTGTFMGIGGNRGITFAFECTLAAPVAIATGFDPNGGCTFSTANGTTATAPSYAAPGPAVVTGGVAPAVFLGSTGFQVCWQGGAVYPDGTFATTQGCSNGLI